MTPTDLFDPRHYAAVRRPLLDAETLPPWCYSDARFFAREVERIWHRAWNFVGHEDQIAEPGDFFALDFAGVPVVILRDRDGMPRAFANTCRHRGSKLVAGSGNCRSLVCPYHSWTYALDGSLAGAPEMHRTHDFAPGQYGLLPLRLATHGRFLFLCFAADAPPLAAWLGDLPERLSCYGLQDMTLARRREYLIGCNWKLFVENAKESYHIATVHQATINRYASARTAGYWVEDTRGEYVSTFARHDGSMALLKGDAGFPPIESLAGRPEAEGTRAPLLYPSTYLALTRDCAWYLELHPLAADRTRLIHGALFPKSRLARPDFAATAANYYKRWDITIEEDIRASESQQQGLASPFARPGRFSWREPLVHAIDNWILDRVLDPSP
jgi:phenylpropionate dioxygenase-like ring-hydroxylating dioxygenase large terminal subunit